MQLIAIGFSTVRWQRLLVGQGIFASWRFLGGSILIARNGGYGVEPQRNRDGANEAANEAVRVAIVGARLQALDRAHFDDLTCTFEASVSSP